MFNVFVFFFKQKTAYEMRISDWSSDVCSSDLEPQAEPAISFGQRDRGPALFLRDGPEGLEDRVPGFKQREQRFGRDMGFEDAARLARDRLLPLVVPDRHAAGPLSGSSTGRGSGRDRGGKSVSVRVGQVPL